MVSCPRCAQENPDSQNFCGRCGARLPGAAGFESAAYTPPHLTRDVLSSRFAIEGERKVVTVLFCDIANSTPLAAQVGAEAMHSLLNRFFELALAEVHDYEGTINQFLGDGFMALFGAPIAHEDHARRALLAATSIQRKMRGPRAEAHRLHELRLRMGLNTGTVVVGKIGDNLRMDYTAIGDTTHVAARLQGIAEPGSIRVSGATRRAAEAHFTFKDLDNQALKGIAETVAVFEPLAARAARSSATHEQNAGFVSPLIGREPQLASLTRCLVELVDGKGSVTLIEGEPGAGKSRLVAEARKSDAATLCWIEGRSLSFGRGLSYWPFVEILRSAFDIDENDGEAEALRKLQDGAQALFEAQADDIVPFLATVMSLALTPELELRVKSLDAQAMRRQVFLRLRQLFERLAQRQPTLVCLEDWHWVDQSSIALCEHLLPLAEGLPIAFWITTRKEPAEPAARIKAAAAALATLPLVEIAVTPLEPQQSHALIANLVGEHALPEAVRNEIERRTEGNPFFIEEVVRTLTADGSLVREPRGGGWRLARPMAALTIPATVQDVITARIDRLDDDVKSVLKLASVIGRSFFLRILQAIAESTANVEHGLGCLEQAELIRLRQQMPELEYIFKHALVQEAAYDSILSERRRAIHCRVGRAIESLFADRVDEFASLLAYHYALAEDWEQAQAYLLKAGDRAGRIAADAEALEHYHQAEATFMKVAGRQLSPLQRAALDRKLGQAYYGVGNYAQCIAQCTRALNQLGIDYPSTRSGLRWKAAVLLLSHFLRRLGLRARPLDLAEAQEISTICRSLSWLDYFVDEERFLLDSLIELQVAERSGDVLGRVRGLSTLAMALAMIRLFAPAWTRVNEATALARDSGEPSAVGHAALARGTLQFATGPLATAGRTFEESANAFQSIGDLRGWGGPTVLLYWTQYWRADFASLDEAASELIRVGTDAGDPHLRCWGHHGDGLLKFATGPLDEAEASLQKAMDLSVQITSIRFQAGMGRLLAKCRLRRGRERDAERALLESLHLFETKGLRGTWSSETYNGLTELWLTQAERARGPARREALRQARKFARLAYGCTRDAVGWLPETQRLQGRLAWLNESVESARQLWQASLASAEAAGNILEHARTLLEMGARLNDAALLEQARNTLEQVGAKVDLAFTLHAQARHAAANPDAEADAVLDRFDQAIAMLEVVKAEHQLALACQQRAELLARRGRRDEARVDLERAQHSLEAAGAPVSLDELRDSLAP